MCAADGDEEIYLKAAIAKKLSQPGLGVAANRLICNDCDNMIIVAENISQNGAMELAMLLDECPYPSNCVGEPWRSGGNLVKSLEAAAKVGRAELYLVFRSDPPRVWGDKLVTALAGGLLYLENSSRPLRYEVVARQIFENCVGQDTSLPYRILVRADITPDPEVSTNRGKEVDDYLGAAEPQAERKITDSAMGDPEVLGSGVTVTWMDQTGYQEIWFVGDSDGLQDYRFDLTEFSRRSYVQRILGALGFVGKAVTRQKRQTMLNSLLQGSLPQLTAIQQLCIVGPENDELSDRADMANAEGHGHSSTNEKHASTHPRTDAVPGKRPSSISNGGTGDERPTKKRFENSEVINLDL